MIIKCKTAMPLIHTEPELHISVIVQSKYPVEVSWYSDMYHIP